MQATEPYNNEESASRDEGGNALAEISADDNIYDIVNISNDDNVSDDDNFEEALAGEMVPVKSTDEMKIHEIQSTVVNSNNKTEAGSKVEGVNSKKAMASNSLSQTISTTDSLVEIESLRTQVSVFYSPALCLWNSVFQFKNGIQVAVVAGFGGALLLLLSAAVLVNPILVDRFKQFHSNQNF